MEPNRKRAQTHRIVFNGNDLSPLVFCKVHRPILPPVSAEFEGVSGRHGELFKSAYLDGYDLPVDIWIRTEHRHDVEAARHRLAEMLYAEEPAPLYLPDDPTRYLMAIVSGSTDLGEITDNCPTTTVTFHVGDPFYYGQAHRVEASAGTVSVNAGGNRPAHLTVTATPDAGDAWYIRNVNTGEKVQVSQALTADSVIRIDMEAEHATVNESTAAVSLDSDYFEIEGRCALQISSGTAVLEWVERWL